MSDRNRRAVKIVKIKDDGIYIEKALKSVVICDIILLCYNINRLQPEYIATKLRSGKIYTQKGQMQKNRFCYC